MLLLCDNNKQVAVSDVSSVSAHSDIANCIVVESANEKYEISRKHSASNQLLTQKLFKELVAEINGLIKGELSIDDVVMSSIWKFGYLRVDFSKANKEVAQLGLATLSWHWPKRPSDEDLQLRMPTESIEVLTSGDYYESQVENLMLSHRQASQFKNWAEKVVSSSLAAHLRVSIEAVEGMLTRIAEKHNISVAIKKKKAPVRPARPARAQSKKDEKPVKKSEPTDYEVVWGSFKEPDSTAYFVYGRDNVTATTLNKAKTLATQALGAWISSETNEKTQKTVETINDAKKNMRVGLALNQGRWEDSRGASIRAIGHHENTWSPLFLRVSEIKGGK